MSLEQLSFNVTNKQEKDMLMFFDAVDFESAKAGQKAANLQSLFKAGFLAPNGFVIPSETLLETLHDQLLQESVERIGGFPVAVRSSGTLEDLDGASFAGQYKSFLMVSDLKELKVKIAECRDSGNSEQVRAYLDRKGLAQHQHRTQSVAVLVQPMVHAVHAGVGFSIDPLSGKEENALIECYEGLGEHLVSGRLVPSRYIIDLFSGKVLEYVKGDSKTEPKGAVLTQLRDRLLQLQAHFGKPQDIEWAIDSNNCVWLLQSRPITKFEIRKEQDEWTNADFRDGGVSARVCTPMMYSLYRNAMQYSLQKYGVDLGLISPSAPPMQWIGVFYGRPYWNASAAKRMLSHMPGFDESAFDRDLGIQKIYGEKGPLKVPTTFKTVVPAIPVALNLQKHYLLQMARGKIYGSGFLKQESRWRAKIAGFSDTAESEFFRDLIAVIDDFHFNTESSYFTVIYNNTSIQSDFKRLIHSIEKSTGEKIKILSLMCGLNKISHIEIQITIFKLFQIANQHGMQGEQWSEALNAFLSKFYYRADSELELTCPRWGEEPKKIELMIRQMIASKMAPINPEVTAQRQKKEFLEEQERVLERLSQRWLWKIRYEHSFKKQLQRMRAYLALREEMRDYSTRCYAVVRQYVLEAGRRLTTLGVLAQPEDVFMLQAEDLTALSQFLCKNDNPRALGMAGLVTETQQKVSFRKLMYQGYREVQAPNEFGLGISQAPAASLALSKANGQSLLQGLPCSPGLIRGRARVLNNIDDMGKIQKGEILVTRFTDPGWTPVLGIVGGVITEVGGVLSHAAVISRELGIPAVLNIPGVTQLLDGKEISMDGSTGVIEVISA
jgi:phosphohistidine swiveling domain-containing protein